MEWQLGSWWDLKSPIFCGCTGFIQNTVSKEEQRNHWGPSHIPRTIQAHWIHIVSLHKTLQGREKLGYMAWEQKSVPKSLTHSADANAQL